MKTKYWKKINHDGDIMCHIDELIAEGCDIVSVVPITYVLESGMTTLSEAYILYKEKLVNPIISYW